MTLLRLCILWTIPLVIGGIIGAISGRYGQPAGVIVAVLITFPSVFVWRLVIDPPIFVKRKRGMEG